MNVTPETTAVRLRCHRIFALAAAFLIGAAVQGAEQLDRGVVAFPNKEGRVYVGWRLLASDPADVAFDVYRSDTAAGARRKLTARPIADSTNFVDSSAPAGGKTGFYSVRAIARGRTVSESTPVGVDESVEIGGLKRIKLQGNYTVQKVGVADFDGDGKLDYLVKQPNFNSDPYVLGKGYWKPSPEPYKLEAYRHDGTFMWRYDMGPGIETGIWYSPIVVYDLDGDGRAEVYCKAGPKDPAEIVRHPDGMVTGGPEFLVKLDGATGRELARVPWPDRSEIKHRTTSSDMADYNYQSRNLLGVAYLDGKRPHLIVQRGTYTMIKIRALDPQLKTVWSFDAKGEYEKYQGQGAHGIQVADIDGDGRDEIVYGAAALDDNGKPLWNTGRGHPDGCYVGRIDPSRPGLQVFYGHEWKQSNSGLCLVDARTGETLWGHPGPTIHIHSTAMVADIDPTRPGMESYGGEANGTQFFLFDAKGNRIGEKPMGGLSPKAVWWADGPTKLIVAGGKLFRFKSPGADEVAAMAAKQNALNASVGDVVRGLKQPAGLPAKVSVTELWPGYVGEVFGPVEGTVIGIADCIGDWREELLVSVAGELRIYSTTTPASTRQVTLMQDRQYRTAVAMQTMGYFYPPMLGGRPLDDYGKK
jgi:rhamnogalacturonan endolyase